MPLHRFDRPQTVDLKQIPTLPPPDADEERLKKETKKRGERLADLADLLYFAGQHSLLVVLQGMDTSGKDGTIREILQYVNAQSTRVAPFKVPTPIELAHDFLWRVHAVTPGKGHITVFNRSHYEDVLVVRVHSLVPESVWQRRYAHINAFEELLADSSTIVLKYFLHVSCEEQEQRLLEREQEVEKAWKLSVGDWKERERWEDYQQAYEDAIGKCSAERAPWHVVPADKKWYRNYLVVKSLVEALEEHAPAWTKALESVGEKAKKELEEYRAGRG
jgi:PPK2 family polyphosphate:nucleotide phosphotransferase